MWSTRKITDASMLIAIVGSMILFDRIFSFLFEDLILLLVPIEVIVYGQKYDFKSSFFLSVGLLFLTIFGNVTTWFYIPVGIIVGLITSYFCNKNKENAFITIISFFACEILVTLILMPILGIVMGLSFADSTKYFMFSFCLMLTIISYIEGVFVYSTSAKIIDRFKFKSIKKINLTNIKTNKKANINNILAIVIGILTMIFTNGLIYCLSSCMTSYFLIMFLLRAFVIRYDLNKKI